MTEKRSFWQRRLVDPIVAQLKQGITPEKIALSIVVGVAISIFPVLGATTTLCLVAGALLRLNHPVVQLANYSVYPLQLALLPVFIRVGERIFRAPPLPFSIQQLIEQARIAPLRFLGTFAVTLLHGAVAWLLIVPPVAALLYFALRPIVRTFARRIGSH